jgi:CheY-like chemotaxis protein
MIFENKRILAVDDEAVVLSAIAKLGMDLTPHITLINDAGEALQQLHRQDYDLILCDIMMPRMDGFEFLKSVNQLEHPVPVVMTTGYCTLEYAIRSLYEGAIDFLPKPFTYDELTTCLRRSLMLGETVGLRQVILNDAHARAPWQDPVPCPATYKRLGPYSWMFVEPDGTVRLGVTDLMLRCLASLDQCRMREPGEELFQGSVCATLVEAEGFEHPLLSPVSGSIVQANAALEDSVHLLEKDPYFGGWLYTLIPKHLDSESAMLIPCSSDR